METPSCSNRTIVLIRSNSDSCKYDCKLLNKFCVIFTLIEPIKFIVSNISVILVNRLKVIIVLIESNVFFQDMLQPLKLPCKKLIDNLKYEGYWRFSKH